MTHSARILSASTALENAASELAALPETFPSSTRIAAINAVIATLRLIRKTQRVPIPVPDQGSDDSASVTRRPINFTQDADAGTSQQYIQFSVCFYVEDCVGAIFPMSCGGKITSIHSAGCIADAEAFGSEVFQQMPEFVAFLSSPKDETKPTFDTEIAQIRRTVIWQAAGYFSSSLKEVVRSLHEDGIHMIVSQVAPYDATLCRYNIAQASLPRPVATSPSPPHSPSPLPVPLPSQPKREQEPRTQGADRTMTQQDTAKWVATQSGAQKRVQSPARSSDTLPRRSKRRRTEPEE